MTETTYQPVPHGLAPVLPEAGKPEHPEYGSCPHCVKAVRVDKQGRLRDHNTPELARGNLKAAYRCPGSGKNYAEHGEFGQIWNLHTGRWQDKPLELPVLLVEHRITSDGLPAWTVAETTASTTSRAAVEKLFDGSKWRIEVVDRQREVIAHLVRIDDENGPVVVGTESEAPMFVNVAFTKLLAQLELAEEATAR